MEQRVSVEVTDAVAYVTMTRGEKYNGLDLDMFEALVKAADRVRADRDIRAVILQGEGPAFSAGLDFASVGKQRLRMLRAFAKLPWQSTNLFQEACWAWRRLPVPVIAVIHGRCYGGGLQLALAADFRFATPDCEFSVMEATWGLVPDMTGTVTLSELVRLDVAKRLTMTAEIFDGTRAAELGIVTEVAEEPLKAAEALVSELVKRSPDSVAASKALFHETWHSSSVRSALWAESRLQLRLLLGKNHQIARTANLAKQLPEFVRRTFS